MTYASFTPYMYVHACITYSNNCIAASYDNYCTMEHRGNSPSSTNQDKPIFINMMSNNLSSYCSKDSQVSFTIICYGFPLYSTNIELPASFLDWP